MSSGNNLSVRPYETADLADFSEWWMEHHGGEFPVNLLPPVGVVVSDEAGPACACWLYMAVSIGVCWLEYPVSRPGLSLAQASDAFKMAVGALESAALELDYGVMIAHTLPPIARVLKRFGFRAEAREKVTTLKVLRHGS